MKTYLTLRPVVAAAMAAVALSGCNLAPKFVQPALSVPDAVSAQAGTPAVANAPALSYAQAQAWIQSSQLREVVALALTHNRDLRIVVENIEKARAQYGITRADLLPSITAQGQGTRSRTSADLNSNGQSSISEQFTAQLGFTSYEIDFWGRVRNLSEAGLQAFLQSEENQRNVQIGLVADVSNAWLSLAGDMARLQLAKDTLASREKAYALTKRMFEIGSTSGLVLAQNLSTVETARADVAAFTSQVARDRNALQLLVGGVVAADLLPTAQTLAVSDDNNLALLPVPEQLPSSVLLKRPDVQAAEHNLRAMNANIGAARAAMFPTISLTGSVGSGSRELDTLFGSGNGTWSFMPQIRLPIFDGGRLRAGVDVANANQRIAVAQYEKTVQTAFKEVADALADRAQWGERLGAQTGMVQATQKAFDLSEARFQAGVDNYLTVLDAQRSLYAAQQTLITLRLAEQTNRTTLWKVLGGQEVPLQ
ncbi:efflux transporter outer membrane subunit [Comamonas avium]|uniref:Efflux transporter outer membrane subunit n=1 Tax=Comamonas avium TaxID=2762231 RepID=A0ABR8S811_9BURK|nr:efflux transporter outer membrane subunit [Comamonas avium]MBD7959234.1 efflux transporter outer membrane subunit [Comamonas avium]